MDGKNVGQGFLKTARGNIIEELAKDHHCFMLMWQIAYRARRSNEFAKDNLNIREALIGDYDNIGLTKQQYRTCKKKLEEWGFVTLKTTNKGTIATIVDERVYDINADNNGQQTNTPATHQQHTANTPLTPNKKVKKEKKEKNVIKYSPEFETFWKAYVRGEEKSPAFGEWLKLLPEPPLIEHIMTAVVQQKINGCLKDPQFAPYARRWIKYKRWTDTPIKAPTPEQKTCIRCDAPANYHIDGEKEWFCSSDCRDKYQRENIR